MKKLLLLLALALAIPASASPIVFADLVPSEAGVNDSILTSLGPFTCAFGTPANTKPATGCGIFNNTITTSAAKILSGVQTSTTIHVRRVKLACVTAGRNCGYTTVTVGQSAPSCTAVGDGTATDGSLITGAPAAEFFNVPDNQDLYACASAASTVYQLTVDVR